MKQHRALITSAALLCIGADPFTSSAKSPQGEVFEISSGSAAFNSPTNVPGVEVKGKSTALSGRVEISRDGSNLVVENVEATVSVKTFVTGMKVRDEHLRKYIFTTSDGQEPDLHFKAERAVCSLGQSGHDYTCALEGELGIRATTKPFRIALNVKESGGLQTFRAAGDGVVKLSTYGIDRPTQLGVQSSDEVKLHLEFNAKKGNSK